jgi:pyruvate dehydrogenase E1 component
MDEIGDQGADDHADRVAHRRLSWPRLMNTSAATILPSIDEAFDIDRPRTPTCFIAYTGERVRPPIAGHKDNHAGLMTPSADGDSSASRGTYRPGHEWDLFEGAADGPARGCGTVLEKVRLPPAASAG